MSKPLFCCLLLFAMLSCQKETDPKDELANCRLVRMVQGVHDGQADDTTFQFEYDVNDRLSKASWITSDDETFSWNMIYDNQGRLVRTQCNEAPGLFETIFRYDSKERLAEIHFSNNDSVKYIFEFDGAGNMPIKCHYWGINFSDGQWYLRSTSEYTSEFGNIVKEDVYQGNTIIRSFEYDYYSDMPNTLGTLSLLGINTIPLGTSWVFYYFNKNMPKAELEETNSDYHIRYLMDSGRIAASIGCFVTPPSTDTTTRESRFFYYECTQ